MVRWLHFDDSFVPFFILILFFMKLCAISDLHGNLSCDVKKSDILCICGDTVPLKIQNYHKPSAKWFKENFLSWAEDQPVKEIYLIGGNHDFFIANHSDELREILKGTNVHYLEDESIKYKDDNGNEYLIYGTPWCHQFGHWAFMDYTDDELANIFFKMPNDVDILLTHDAPYGVSDICQQDIFWNEHMHIGNHALTYVVGKTKPKLLLHGHLHTSNHSKEMLDDTPVYNVSLLDENYDMVFKPLYLEI